MKYFGVMVINKEIIVTLNGYMLLTYLLVVREVLKPKVQGQVLLILVKYYFQYTK
jgi:hypothetical protein